jgi:hypothetical protein
MTARWKRIATRAVQTSAQRAAGAHAGSASNKASASSPESSPVYWEASDGPLASLEGGTCQDGPLGLSYSGP